MVAFDDITDLQTVATDHNPYWVSMCTIDQGIKTQKSAYKCAWFCYSFTICKTGVLIFSSIWDGDRLDPYLGPGWSGWKPLTKTKTTTNIWSLKHQEQCLNMISNEEFWLLIQTFSVQVMNFNHNCECYLYIFWINIVNIPSYRPEELHGYHSSFNF